jgi:hypothetical protein
MSSWVYGLVERNKLLVLAEVYVRADDTKRKTARLFFYVPVDTLSPNERGLVVKDVTAQLTHYRPFTRNDFAQQRTLASTRQHKQQPLRVPTTARRT